MPGVQHSDFLYEEAMSQVQKEWEENRDFHQLRHDFQGMRSSQVSALVMWLIKKEVIREEHLQ